ncbi:hypothetical protein [Halocatena pleomorpha]|uniref:hypothetical protein n=1 Tax=Halocatena pleomorpha TaxID=1785090 RepID=UPI000F614521|nr:hypothetical protein [Halocatena pleomorpha]
MIDGPYEFDDRVDPDWYLFEARLLQDGIPLSVYGELRRSENELVVGGSDDQPLFITDQGFESHRQWLKRRILKKGLLMLAVCVITVGIFLEVYWPLLIASVANVLRVFYHGGTYIMQWTKYR